MNQDHDQVGPVSADHLAVVRLKYEAEARRFERAKADLRDVVDQIRTGRSRRQTLHDSTFARLQAKLESMPVIEQAKGILMAEQRCGPDQAFDLLRRASQRANIKVSVLAAQIVEHVASQPTRLHAVPAQSRASRENGEQPASSESG